MTGEKVFEIYLPAPEQLSSVISILDNKVLMPRTQTLLCWDAVTGKQLWQEDGQSSGSTRRFQAHRGKLYFASRGDGHLHALDIVTGKHIWKIKSPDKQQDPVGGFSGIVTVDSDNNRLYTATYVNAICYKTAD